MGHLLCKALKVRRRIFENDAVHDGQPIKICQQGHYMIMLLDLVTSFAAEFCTCWICNVRTEGAPARRALLPSNFDVT